MSTVAEPKYYLVRTIPALIQRDIVGVGWSDFNFAEIGDAEETIRQINADYGIGRWGNQIRRFYQIAECDVVVAPLPYSVAIGRATGDLFFDQDHYNDDRANQRRVHFPRNTEGSLLTVPRASFSEAFQRRLRVQGMTVNDLGEFRDEIQKALGSLEGGTSYHWSNRLLEAVAERQKGFKEKLLENIRSGKTNLETGGVGLENLVHELLTIDGYKAEVLSKRQFGGFADADVQASRSDRCAAVDLLVQVKHHQGYSDEYGIRQLEEIRRVHPGEYDDHRRVFLTSASVNEELKQKAETLDIAVIDGPELVDWIAEHIERLSKPTKLALGIYEVPAVL